METITVCYCFLAGDVSNVTRNIRIRFILWEPRDKWSRTRSKGHPYTNITNYT